MTIKIETGFEVYSEAIEWRYNNPKGEMADYFTSRDIDADDFFENFTAWIGIGFNELMLSLQIKSVKATLPTTNISKDENSGNNYETLERDDAGLPKIIKITPDEYTKLGALQISYHFAASKFGKLLVASSEQGICFLALGSENQRMFNELKSNYPNATFSEKFTEMIERAILSINTGDTSSNSLILHLKCTPFQQKVWESLLQIPRGALTTYAGIATQSGFPTAHRAVGTAVGSNPVSLIIPCHRVISSNGKLGQYRWSAARKKAIIAWEIANSR